MEGQNEKEHVEGGEGGNAGIAGKKGSFFTEIGGKLDETVNKEALAAGKEKAEAFVKENLNKDALKANAEKAGAFIKGNANKEGVKAGAEKARGLIGRLPFRGLAERHIPQSARAKVPLLNAVIPLVNYIALALAAVVLINIVTPSGTGSASGRSRQVSPFHGEWLNLTGTVTGGSGADQRTPFVVTIGRDFFHLVDGNGNGAHIANPVWTRAENTRSDTRAEFPQGFTVSGHKTTSNNVHYPLETYFVALSRDGRMLWNLNFENNNSAQMIFDQAINGGSRTAAALHGTWGNSHDALDHSDFAHNVIISADKLLLTGGMRNDVLLWDYMAAPLWIPAANPREDTRADFPNGFIISARAITDDNRTPYLRFFAALNRDGQLLLNFEATNPHSVQRIFDKAADNGSRSVAAFLGSWGNARDDNGILPHTVTISADNFHHTGITTNEGVLLWDNMANPLWIPAANPSQETRAAFPSGYIIEGPAVTYYGRAFNWRVFAAVNGNGQLLLNYNIYDPGPSERIFERTGNNSARPQTAPPAMPPPVELITAAVVAPQRTAPAPFATVASRPAPPAPAAPAQPAQGGGGGGAAPTARITSVDTSWSRVTLSNGQTLSISSHRDAVLSRNTGTLVVLYRAGEYWAYSGFRLAHNGTHYRMDSIGTSTTDSFGNPGIHRGTTRAGGGGAMFE